jgi:uncharacterized membrane protein
MSVNVTEGIAKALATKKYYKHEYELFNQPSFFPIIRFGSTTLLTGMTGISLHMQWPLTSQSHGSFSLREQLFFCYGSNSTPLSD